MQIPSFPTVVAGAEVSEAAQSTVDQPPRVARDFARLLAGSVVGGDPDVSAAIEEGAPQAAVGAGLPFSAVVIEFARRMPKGQRRRQRRPMICRQMSLSPDRAWPNQARPKCKVSATASVPKLRGMSLGGSPTKFRTARRRPSCHQPSRRGTSSRPPTRHSLNRARRTDRAFRPSNQQPRAPRTW